jgi:hypothetical protein
VVGGNKERGEKRFKMADFATPEYEKLIQEFMRRNQQQVAQANAGAIGEAQRRGLVGQTGTSDIEASLRAARTQPIVESGQGQVAGLLKEMSDQRLQDQRTAQQQGYNTSERLGGQQFQSNMAGYTDPNTGQWIQTGVKPGQYGEYGSGIQQQGFDEHMANLQRQWQQEDEKKAKKRRWGDIGAAVVGGVAGGFGQGIGTGVGYGLIK